MAEYVITGRNREPAPGTYTLDDVVIFSGTSGKDTFFGGGGESLTIFTGTPGRDLYGIDAFTIGYVDYSAAPGPAVVHLDLSGGTRTITDESGDIRSVPILGVALADGYGSTDFYAAAPADTPFDSSIFGVFGSAFDDVLIGNSSDLYGNAGDDKLIGSSLDGGEGNDLLIGRSEGNFSSFMDGGVGNDVLWDVNDSGTMRGGDGDDRIFARAGDDGFVVGQAGDDYIDGGAGNDFIDGGIGADTLVSGSGNDTINPDVEFFQSNPDQPTDGERDVIRVGRSDVGDFTDVVLSRSFEAGVDEIKFGGAMTRGRDYRVFHEAQSINEATGLPYRRDDLADVQNTVLQIDWNRNGFGDDVPDPDDYFLVIIDATLSEQGHWLLT